MSPAFSPLSLEDLFELELPELEFAVSDLIPVGSAVLLSAREKSGKGLLTIDLCGSIALQESFLDRSVRQGPAIYCAAEEHVRLVRDRIKARVGARTDIPLHVLRLDGSTDDRLDLEQVETVQKLDRMMEELTPTMVVIDTLREIHRGREDTSDDMAPLLKPLRQLAHKHGSAIVTNHHMNKLGGSRGSTAIPAAFDVVLHFTRDDDAGEDAIVGMLKAEGRDVRRQSLPIAFGDDGRWRIHEAPSRSEDGTRSQILALLVAETRGLTADEIAARLNMSPGSVKNLLTKMRREEPNPFLVLGMGHRNSPYVYRTLRPEMNHHNLDLIGGDDRMNHFQAAPAPV